MMSARFFLPAICFGFLSLIPSCDNPADPTEMGGDTNLELTQVGGVFAAYLNSEPVNTVMNRLEDSVKIVSNDNGVVNVDVRLKFDSVFVYGLDTALGTAALPETAKRAAIDRYLAKFNATLDTSNKSSMRVGANLKLKVTSEGIQDYVGSPTTPHTIVKYGAAVGDKYEFTNSEGVKVTRTVTYRSTTDDYPIGFMNIKVVKVEQTQEDALIEKITYVANHKFGLVGVILTMKNGAVMKLGIIPPNM